MEGFLGLPADSLDNYGWRGLAIHLGNQLKSTSGWPTGTNGTNTSGFNALPGGYRYAEDGSFNLVGTLSYWWTSTQTSSVPTPPDTYDAWYRRLDGSTNPTMIYRSYVAKQGGKYVRCVKN
jgi:uncharacterized protein (TIGR02145 family)